MKELETQKRLNNLCLFYVAAADCPYFTEKYAKVIDELEWMVDLRPEVIEDVTAIRDAFPCNEDVITYLETYVSNIFFGFSQNWSSNFS